MTIRFCVWHVIAASRSLVTQTLSSNSFRSRSIAMPLLVLRHFSATFSLLATQTKRRVRSRLNSRRRTFFGSSCVGKSGLVRHLVFSATNVRCVPASRAVLWITRGIVALHGSSLLGHSSSSGCTSFEAGCRLSAGDSWTEPPQGG